MKTNKSYIALLLGSVVLFSACGSGENQDGGAKSDDSKFEYKEEEQNEADERPPAEETTYFLPSALQIGSVFKQSGLTYADGVVNNPNNVSRYESKTAKLLNFGAYSADLAYCVLNGQSQVAMNQLKSLRSLASGIGMESVFNSEGLFKKFEKNMGNQDSIIDVMVQIQENTDMFIDDNNMQSMANIIFAGAWVEGMYIGVKATTDESEEQITSRLVEQMVILDNLVKALNDTENMTEDLEKLHTQLKDLRTYFNELPEVKGKEDIDYKKLELSTDHLKPIADRIVKMRTQIVNPS